MDWLQIERGEINASLDTTDTVTFCDGNDTFTPADVDKWVRAAQIQGAIISEEDRIMGRSKDFLSKANQSIIFSFPLFRSWRFCSFRSLKTRIHTVMEAPLLMRNSIIWHHLGYETGMRVDFKCIGSRCFSCQYTCSSVFENVHNF